MHEKKYEELLHLSNIQSKVAEKPHSYHILTERHLQAMWLEQKHFTALKTYDGIPIEVLSPGIWNGEAGPDFLKAHLKIGNTEFRGDIELHLSDESWYHHQHHLDPRYNQVILHIGFWKTNKAYPIINSLGKSILSTQMQSFLKVSEAQITKLIDLDLYPYKHFNGGGRCASTLFSNLNEEKTLELFQSAARWRLTQKRQHLLAKDPSSNGSIICGMAMALGYKQNAEAFYAVYHFLKNLPYSPEATLYAQALALCGFFSEHHQEKWRDSLFYQSLKNYYVQEQLYQTIPYAVPLRCNNIRPANHPLRRLAILVKMIIDKSLNDLDLRLINIWDNYCLQYPQDSTFKKLLNELLNVIPTYSDFYWQHHYTFETKTQSKPITMVGKDLKHQILINVFLPFLFETIERKNDSIQLEIFENFFHSINATKSRKSAYLAQRFFGDTPKNELLSRANTQQGAYQIHHDFCIHHEASCIGCPFVERYSATFGQYHATATFAS